MSSHKLLVTTLVMLSVLSTTSPPKSVSADTRPKKSENAPTTCVYVTPDGNDAHTGTLRQPNAGGTDGPLATLTGARNAVRKLRKGDRLPGPVRVIVADGTYRITEPLVLAPQDGGTAETPISYEAAEGAAPVISGGRVIRGWTKGNDGLWTAHIDDVAEGRWFFEQLFVGGRRAIRAREPDEFYFYMDGVDQEILSGGESRRPAKARQRIRLGRDDFEKTLALLGPGELKDVQIQIYHKWDNTRRFIDRIDREKALLVTEGKGMKSWNNWHRNTRYHLENFRAALDTPGEWFLSRGGTLYYKPRPGEDMTQADVVAPAATEKFIVVAAIRHTGSSSNTSL